MKKNVPGHILAPSAVACGMFLLRASAHSAERFCFIGRNFLWKKSPCRTYHLQGRHIRGTTLIQSGFPSAGVFFAHIQTFTPILFDSITGNSRISYPPLSFTAFLSHSRTRFFRNPAPEATFHIRFQNRLSTCAWFLCQDLCVLPLLHCLSFSVPCYHRGFSGKCQGFGTGW